MQTILNHRKLFAFPAKTDQRFTATIRLRWLKCIAALLLATAPPVLAATFQVDVGAGNIFYDPSDLTIHAGDTVQWNWVGTMGHSVTSGVNGISNGQFDSGTVPGPNVFSFTFPSPGTFNYYCKVHFSVGMEGVVRVLAGTTPPTAAQPLNISTRLRVQTGENVMIGGFIISGTAPKKVILRAIGPSLVNAGIQDFLADPVIEVHDATSTVATNDNWKTRSDGSSQQAEIEATTVAPTQNSESALVATLPANNANYTAIVSGKNATSGIAVVEVYDLDQAANSRLANISTRGLVQIGTNVMIGGFILGGGSGNMNLIVRGIGPSLGAAGVSGALPDPTLELRDGNGALLRSNNDWKTRPDGSSQQAEVQATGVQPQNELESAIVASLPPGSYTAIVAGNNGTVGVGVVELYRLP